MDDKLRSAFLARMRFAPGVAHLNNAGVCPAAGPAVDAVHAFMELHAREGCGMIPRMVACHESARGAIARLIGAEPDWVAHFPTCSASISAVAFGFPLDKGDEILIWDQEYPSNAYPWYAAARRAGATVRTVSSNKDFSVDTSRMAEAIGPRTRIVAVSWAQSRTGAMTDLRMLSEACRRTGAWLVADVIQAVGVVPFDMKAEGVDAVCCGTQKWLCGPLGHGFLALRPERLEELMPVPQGAITYGMPYDPVDPDKPPRRDARRYEPGCPIVLGAVGTEAAISVLMDAGVEAINRHANLLARRLIDNLREEGHTVLSTSGIPGKSPIVTFRPRGELAPLSARLNSARVTFTERDGTLRLSPHGFNTEEEIELALDAVRGT